MPQLNVNNLKPGTYKVISSTPTSPANNTSTSSFPTQEPEEVEKSFASKLAGFVGSVANPFLRLGATANALSTSKYLGGTGTNNQPVDLGSFGSFKPITTAKDAIGVGVELGSFAVGGGAAGSVAKAGLTGAIKEAGIQGLKAGALSGALTGGGRALQEDKSAGETVRDTIVGAGVGGAAGAALGGILSGLGHLSGRSTGFTPKEQKIITNRQSELGKLEGSYKVLRKQSEKASERGIDVKKLLAETDLLHNSVDNTGTIRTQNAITELNDFIKPQESVISETLQREGKKVPLGLVRQKMVASVNESGLKGGAKLRALRAVDEDVAGYALEADKDGYISLSILHEAKVDKYANLNYMNPESKRADKAIAKGLKETVEQYTDSVDVAQLNNELGQFYTLQSYLEALDGKKVEGGKLGKYFAQTIGSVVGSHFGPVGAVAGAEIAGRLKGAQMASKFSKPVSKSLQQSPTMQSAIEKNVPKIISLPGKVLKSAKSLIKR